MLSPYLPSSAMDLTTLPSCVCTSARRTTRLPSGQMTWSTWERTRSHVSSGVRRLVWKEDGTGDGSYSGKEGKKALQQINEGNLTTSISVLECPILHTIQLFFMRSKCSRVTTFLFPKGKGEQPKMLGDKGTRLPVRTWEKRTPAALKGMHPLWETSTLCNSFLHSVIWF